MSSSSRSKKSSKNKNSSPASTPSKKKKPNTPSGSTCSTPVPVEVDGTAPQEPAEASPAAVESQDKIPIFKDPNFVHSTKGAAGSKKTRVWKNLKQIVVAEKSLPWKPSDVTYGSIDAPPSFKPAKKYSDLSGLMANYRDPETKLRYATAEEYSRIKMMPSDVVTGCLALRKATTTVP